VHAIVFLAFWLSVSLFLCFDLSNIVCLLSVEDEEEAATPYSVPEDVLKRLKPSQFIRSDELELTDDDKEEDQPQTARPDCRPDILKEFDTSKCVTRVSLIVRCLFGVFVCVCV
jgi:hypothetical protein